MRKQDDSAALHLRQGERTKCDRLADKVRSVTDRNDLMQDPDACDRCFWKDAPPEAFATPTAAASKTLPSGRVSAADLITAECDAVREMLLEKNRAYGNSALEPVRIFSKSDPEEQIRVRLDDKLSRLARGSAAGEDVELDLIGYLVLLRVSRRMRP